MKKILAILLVLVMLIPMCLVTGAEEQTQNNRPYTVLNWGGAPKKYKTEFVYSAPYFWIGQNDVSDPVSIYAFGSYSVKKIAAAMKENFDKRPDGTRYINFDPIRNIISHFAENYIYLDKGADVLAKWMDKFLKEYQSIGGKLDGIIMDCEYIHMGSWYINMYAQKDLTLLNKIVQDPRYQTQVRPLLEERGFTFWDKPSEYTPEIYTIMQVHGTKHAQERAIWDTVMEILRVKAMNTAITEPMLRYFPDATTSDYQTMDFKGWYKGTTDNSGTDYRAGNATNNNMYFIRPRETFYQSTSEFFFNKPDSSYIAPYYDQTPFHQALYELNMFKNSLASCDSGKIQIWIPFYDYGYHWPDVYDYYDEMASNTPYYSEIIFHMATLDPHPFLGYIVESDIEGYGDYDHRVEVADQVMKELNRVLGADDRKTIMVPAAWNDSFILSGMYTGGRNVWRITPDTKKVSVEDFLIEGTDPTFYVNGKTVTFPGGKIIADGTIDEVGTCGYWVETAADVYPEYTTDADRFEKIPAFQANFENWTLGAFDYNKVYPAGGWDLTRDSDAVIEVVKDGEDQAMAMSGTLYLENIKMPASVYAGDTYAKKQEWSVEITIPEGLAADAEIYVLKYSDKMHNVEDTGFMIAGGKLYYDQEGESVELCDISAGTYTFVRQMELSDLEAPKCSYYVYNADGSELASALDIATLELGTAVVNSIGIDCVDVNNRIIVDDYAIRIWGLNADLTLYNAFTGMQLEDQEAIYSGDTAYRFGWLNASDETVTAQVVADIYEGDTLVDQYVVAEELMLPGDDSVIVGVVDINDGQSVKLSLQTVKANQPNGNGGNGGNGGGNSGANNTVIIVLLIVAALVCTVCSIVPVVAAVLLLPKKKK